MTNKKKKIKIKKYDEMLKKHIDKKNVVTIKRTVTEGNADISGIILKLSKNFLLIQKSEEFWLNGYAIIRKDHFDAIRHNKYDKTYQKILIGEGIIEKDYGIQFKISLDDWKSIFSDLMKNDIHVIVECEDLKKPTFTIGPIEKVNNGSVRIRYYDPTGTLKKKTIKIDFKKVTVVKFGDRYIEVFKKYLKRG